MRTSCNYQIKAPPIRCWYADYSMTACPEQVICILLDINHNFFLRRVATLYFPVGVNSMATALPPGE
jgi:hypothetical protein